VRGWRPETGPGLDAALEALATDPLTVVGRLPWSSNLTFLVALGVPEDEGDDRDDATDDAGDDAGDEPDDGTDGALHAVYKPAGGEQSLWDFPDGLYRREVAAYALSEALGWGLVPPTVARDDAPFGDGSLQLFVDTDYQRHYFTLLEDGGYEDTLMTMCAFDVVANNADRKSGHVLVGSDDRLWGIDHGLCFHHHHKLRTVIWDFAGEDVPARLLADLVRLADDLPDELAALLPGPERRALVDRIDHLVATGSFPEPTGDRPPYPWPLV
jgi:uncharacterized repeat protein (TIGR03843 family)